MNEFANSRCAEGWRLYLDWAQTPASNAILSAVLKDMYTTHLHSCPECSQGIKELAEAARNAEHPEVTE